MSASPVIFISAVSSELGTARDLCARLLTGLNYQPDWQNVFPTDGGELLAMLDGKVMRCDAVLALVGRRYGAEPAAPTPEFGRVSYTQYEVLRAQKLKRKIILIFCDTYPPPEGLVPEPAELVTLQQSYCAKLRASLHLYHTADSPLSLENAILKVRDDLAATRRKFRVWLAAVLVVALAGAGIGVWQAIENARTKEKVVSIESKLDKLLAAAVRENSAVNAEVKIAHPDLQGEAAEAAVYEKLASRLHVDAQVLRKNLPAYAAALQANPNAALLDRANAAYTAKDYAEAERLALAAAHEAETAAPPRPGDALQALTTAGWSAFDRIEYERSLTHFQAAAAHTDRARDGITWARVQHAMAYALIYLGRARESEIILRPVVEERTHAPGPDHPDTLRSRNNLAGALNDQGRSAEAEAEHRAVAQAQERLFGAEAPDTIRSRIGVANALYCQGKYSEAVAAYEAIYTLQERLLGPNHLETLATRDNLANARNAKGDSQTAEAEHRAVLKVRAQILGPDHPDTLRTRMNLAVSLDALGKPAEAEPEYRLVWQARERLLGPEHPDTLYSRMNLANALFAQRKFVEIEKEYRAVWRAQERVLGPEHPDTLRTRMNLANTLDGQGHIAEAETEYRATLPAQVRVLGPEHPETLTSRVGLAWVLEEQARFAEAETENRAVLVIYERILGADHADTLNVRCNLAGNLVGVGKFDEAEREARASLIGREKRFGAESSQVAESLWQVARALRGLGKLPEARDFAKRGAAMALKTLGADHPYTKQYTALSDELSKE